MSAAQRWEYGRCLAQAVCMAKDEPGTWRRRPRRRRIATLAPAVCAVLAVLVVVSPPAAAAPFTVTSTGDGPDKSSKYSSRTNPPRPF